LADGVLSTIAHTYKFNLSSEIGERIQHYELLVDIASLLKVVDKKITWFTRLDVLILIYHYFFFTTNSLAHQPTTSQYLQPLALQSLVLIAPPIHCLLSEYASGMKASVKFSQDVY
jgi:hypothetical protein